MSAWWIAVSNVQCERRATAGLVEKGFEVWWPKRVVEVRIGRARYRACRLFPAFPGYLFVRSINGVTWHEMIGVDGLKAILNIDFKPLVLSDEKVEQLKVWLKPEAVMPVEDAYRIGKSVYIADGPFASFTAIIKRLVGEGHVIVEADLFGRSVPVSLERGQIRSVA